MVRIVLLALAVAGCGGKHGYVTGWVSGTFGGPPDGARNFKRYVPTSWQPGMPLVTVLHGCTSNADQTDAVTRFSQLAESRGFAVVYPEQSADANALLCWNWFNPADQMRDHGEPEIIYGITTVVASELHPGAAYVIGISAGGAMSVVMGATYPDRYDAVGVVAGCEYGGFPCDANGGPDPTTQALKAYQAMGTHARVVPVIVFQGDADTVVPPINGQQVMDQWLGTDDWADDGAKNGSVINGALPMKTMTAPGGETYDVQVWIEITGAPLVAYYLVHGAGHAWPGGAPSQPFSDPSGPDASNLALDFFFAHARH